MGLCWTQWIHTRFLKPGDSCPSILGNFLISWVNFLQLFSLLFLSKNALILDFLLFFSNLPTWSFALSRKLYLEFVYTYSCLLALFLFLPIGFTSLFALISVFHIRDFADPGNSWYPLMNKTKKLTGSFVNTKACQLWTSLWEGLEGLCWERPIVAVFGLFLLGWSDCLKKSLMMAGHGERGWGQSCYGGLCIHYEYVYFILAFSPFLSRDCLQVNTCPVKKCVVALWCGVGDWI